MLYVRYYIAPIIGAGTLENPYKVSIDNIIDITAGEGYTSVDHPVLQIAGCKVTALQKTHDDIIRLGLATPVSNIALPEDVKSMLSTQADQSIIDDLIRAGFDITNATDKTYLGLLNYIMTDILAQQRELIV